MFFGFPIFLYVQFKNYACVLAATALKASEAYYQDTRVKKSKLK